MKTLSEIVAMRPMPKTFQLCVKTDCPRAAECLRHVALPLATPDVQSITIINPAYLATVEGDCSVFHSAAPVRYAQGFVKMLSNLTVAQANALRVRLERRFGHTLYFRLRSGKRLIDPVSYCLCMLPRLQKAAKCSSSCSYFLLTTDNRPQTASG